MYLKRKDFFNQDTLEQGITEQVVSEQEVTGHGNEEYEKMESKQTADEGADVKKDEVYEQTVRDADLLQRIEKTEAYCRDAGRNDLIGQAANLRRYLESARFSAAVVGEFNRGKSTVVNRLIEKDIIPTSTIPTTTLPIHVTGNQHEAVIYRAEKILKEYPMEAKSWDALQKETKGKANEGEIYLQRNCSFLMENDLELIDTPGVNSQIKGDVQMAERALAQCDCAIVVMAAVAAFGESEDMFLRERILMKKIPRTMVVLTKLDLVEEKDRENVLRYVLDKLSRYDTEIPLCLLNEGLVPGWEEHSGPEAIKKQLLMWLKESGHIALKKEKAYQTLQDIRADLAEVCRCQLEILEEEEDGRKAAAEKKKQQLKSSAFIQWDQLEVEMLNRCSQNFDWLKGMTGDKQEDVIERMQYELSHTGNPKEWWENDYPYRIKMEMISFSTALENNLQNFYMRDAGWLNKTLQEKYGIAVPPKSRRMADKSVFRNPQLEEAAGLENMKRTRIVSRIGTGAATVAGYLIFGTMGLSPLGMAIGIGGGVLSEIFINRRIEAQKEKLSQLLRNELPKVFSACIETVEENMREVYLSEIRAMKDACTGWAEEKCRAIDAASSQPEDSEGKDALRRRIRELEQLGRA